MTIRSKQKIVTSKPFNIVLVNPEIPPNTGNIARLCAATNSTLHLIHPLGFEISDKELKRAGLDYWHLLNVNEHKNWQDFIKKHNKTATSPPGAGPSNDNGNFWYISTRGEKTIWDASFNPGDFLVFGSETKGLSEDILNSPENKEKVISIPMNGLTRSINLSSAVAIILYEAIRQVTIEKKIFEIAPV